MPQMTAVIIGANADRKKWGNKSLRAHQMAGYRCFAVNPAGEEVEGAPGFTSIADVPAEHIDRVSMYVNPVVGIGLLEAIAAKGCDELYLNPGTSSPELVERAESLGLNPVEGCSIVDLGISPAGL
jgi:predicted CoA-binding protein